MPKVIINGQEIEVPQGTTVLAACEEVGIRIPYFCWHPALSIAGNCRMCLVEVEKLPKLVISCNTVVTEGMVVHTTSERVKKAQQGVLEIMLANHPLDCPICDQAGECELQNRYFDFSLAKSNFHEEKLKKPKNKLLSDKIVFDGERCILCSRCVRFSDEISKESELGIFERGAESVIDVFPGKQLESPYQLNMVDICPVGALTSADFRFKCRVWYLKPTAGVCTKCSRGCSIIVDREDNVVHRYRPRKNPYINDFWMCDEGRLSYKEIAENRVLTPMIRGADGKLAPASWDDATKLVATKLKALGGESVAAVASAFETNEANWALRKFFSEALGSANLGSTAAELGMGEGDDFLRTADKTPNRTGLAKLGLATGNLTDEKCKGLFLMGGDVSEETAAKAEFLVVATPTLTELAKRAHVVLPSAQWRRLARRFRRTKSFPGSPRSLTSRSPQARQKFSN
jgi:NADH-quinone oxidoreductase subunit G